MYKIGYIKGYDTFNTMQFDTIEEQKAFFEAHVLRSIDAYYPPHYTNVISLDNKDVPIDLHYNFVILIHNDIYFYYFINNIDYINEELYNITIEMDTVQTLMFYTNINNAIQTRESIARWDVNAVNKINRNYIRENVSKGDFQTKEYNLYNDNHNYIILLSTKNYTMLNEGYIKGNIIHDSTKYPLGYSIYLLPVPKYHCRHVHLRIYNTSTEDYDTTIYNMNTNVLGNLYKRFLEEPETINIFVSNSNFLNNVYKIEYEDISGSNDKNMILTLSTDYKTIDIEPLYEPTGSGTYNEAYGFCIVNYYDKLLKTTAYDFNIKGTTFNTNYLKKQPFSFKYIPQLIDENYIQLQYGETLGLTATKYYELEDISVNLFDSYDIVSGSRSYLIKGISDNKFDKFFTLKVNNSTETVNLINDAWKTYEASHKGSLTTGLALQYTNAFYNLFKGELSSMGMASAYELAPQTKYNKGMKSLGLARGVIGGVSTFTDSVMDFINIKSNYNINKENLEATPDKVGQGSVINSDILNNSFTPVMQVKEVSDIEQCARILEYYGYKVNKTLVDIDLYNLPKNRGYYNVYKFENITVSFKDLFVSKDLEHNLIERLQSGVRMFDVSRNDNNDITFVLTYDNLEEAWYSE